MTDIWWILALLVTPLIFWALWRRSLSQKPNSVSQSHGNVGSEWRARCLELGLDSQEIHLVDRLSQHIEDRDTRRLLNSRIAFENALERSLQVEPQLFQDLSMRRALDRLRMKRGWEVSGEISQRGQLPIEEDELHVEGPGGVAMRAVVIHRDDQTIALRIIDSFGHHEEAVAWKMGTDLEVNYFQPENGCLSFEARLQEIRDLGDLFLFMECPKKIRISQRRQYLRTPIKGRISYLRLPMNRDVSLEERETGVQFGGLVDVGTGGAAIWSEAPLQDGDLLMIRDFPGQEDVDITARVVDVSDPEENENSIYGIRFIGLSAAVKDGIAAFVYSRRAEEVPPASAVSFQQPELGTDHSAG